MDLYGIGFSNIRMPNKSNDLIFTYDYRINTFPEEVFVHEFLHTLERTLKENDYDIPELHGYQEFGYTEDKLSGLKDWYQDYMNCEIKANDGKMVGLDEVVYTMKPPHESDFEFSIDIPFSEEPSNIFEEIKVLLNVIIKMFKGENNLEIYNRASNT